MSGLGDLLGGADEAARRAVSDARLGDTAEGAVHTRVRRSHARRSALRASMVAIAVVVLGAAGVYGAARVGPAQVADSGGEGVGGEGLATPTVTASPTAAAMPPFAGTVTVDAHLPEASAITPEVWASVEPGWSLVSYREAWGIEGAEASGPQVVYLASPEGVLYELTGVAGDTVGVLAWDSGATTAAVSVQPDGEAPYMGVLDLVSGEVTRVGDYAPYMESLAFLAPDGEPVWRGNDATAAYMSVAPDGTAAAYVIPAEDGALDVAGSALGLQCWTVSPFDEESVLVQCGGDVERNATARVWPAEDLVEELNWDAVSEGSARWPTRAGESAVALLGTDCFSAIGTYTDGVYGILPGSDGGVLREGNYFTVLGTVDDRLYWSVSSACSGDASPVVVARSSLRSDDFTVLVPFPEGRPSGEEPFQSVTGVAVAR